LKFDVLNEVQQALFIDRHSSKSGLTTSTDLQGGQLSRYTDTPHYLGAISILREADVDEKLLAGCSIVDGLDRYRDLLKHMRYVDYSAIMETAAEVLNCEQDVRQRLAERIRHVIVDEYQDVNPIQEAIVWSLHELGARICFVGDDDQTIYQWRGGDVQNILTFQKRYPGVAQVRLEKNFRSSEGIVETARAFTRQRRRSVTNFVAGSCRSAVIKRSRICRECSIQLSEAGSNITGDIIARRFTRPCANWTEICASTGRGGKHKETGSSEAILATAGRSTRRWKGVECLCRVFLPSVRLSGGWPNRRCR
jgi:hypothetical protein